MITGHSTDVYLNGICHLQGPEPCDWLVNWSSKLPGTTGVTLQTSAGLYITLHNKFFRSGLCQFKQNPYLFG